MALRRALKRSASKLRELSSAWGARFATTDIPIWLATATSRTKKTNMLILVGPLLFILLGVSAVALKKRGLSGGEIFLFIVVGTVCIAVVMFGIPRLGIFRLRLKAVYPSQLY